jgi:hypothetical protein
MCCCLWWQCDDDDAMMKLAYTIDQRVLSVNIFQYWSVFKETVNVSKIV